MKYSHCAAAMNAPSALTFTSCVRSDPGGGECQCHSGGGPGANKDEVQKLKKLPDVFSVCTMYTLCSQLLHSWLITFQESREELIGRLDSQYRALIDKYESLLDVYNQTRESRDLEHVTSETGPSIREELGLMEVSMDTLDIVTEGRGEEGDTVYCLDKDGVKEDENIAAVCEMYSESSSSGYCDNSEPEELDMEAEETTGGSESQETPAQTQSRHIRRHQTLFSQMFTLLNSELNS